MGIDIEHGFQPEYVVIEARRRCWRRSRRPPRRRGRVLLAPDPDREGEAIAWHIAEEVREVEPEHPARAVQRDHQEGDHRGDRQADGARREEVRVAAGAAHPRPAGRLRDQPGAVDEGAARAVGRPRAVGGGAPGRRARGGDHRVQAAGVLDRRGDRRGADAAAVHAPRSTKLDGKKAGAGPRGPGARGRRRHEARAALRVAVGRAQGAAQEPAAAVHHLEAAAGGVEQAALLAQADDGPGPAPLRRRRDGRRGPGRSHHVHAYRLDAHLRRRASPRRARTSASVRRRRSCPPSRSSTRRRRARRTRTRRSGRPALKYDPETVRALWAGGKGGGRDERETRRPAAALHADLEPLRRLPDGAGGLRSDDDRHRGGARRAARDRPGDQVPRLPRRSTPRRSRTRSTRTRPARRCPTSRRATTIKLLETKPEQHFTQPPPRFSEATLVKELEEKGIGRPSTYAAILSTIQDRGYVEKKEGRLYPTELGRDGQRPAREELPRHRQHRLHRADGGAARPGRGGRRPTGSSCSTASTRRSSSISRRPRSRCAT